ncbi:hypothetical protein BCI9360_01255 [Bacillus sp. CECT 9360]|nr:hypothetical protein BCI9360_01255 [Bacillus sp. CECT 9360]
MQLEKKKTRNNGFLKLLTEGQARLHAYFSLRLPRDACFGFLFTFVT